MKIGEVHLYQGDCLEVMRDLPGNSIDTVITDPPYALEFMGKGWDKVLPSVEVWREVSRLLKPGGTLLAFGGTRTYHRLTCSIEDAGFEIRDVIMYLYGGGFPKSLDISKAIDKAAGKERERIRGVRSGVVTPIYAQDKWTKEYRDSVLSSDPITDDAKTWDGWGTALKPSFEPIVVCQNPLDGTFAENALRHGVAGLNIDGARVGTELITTSGRSDVLHKKSNSLGDKWSGKVDDTPHEGRWPANIIHDGSDEVVGLFPDTNGDRRGECDGKRPGGFVNVGAGNGSSEPNSTVYADKGSVARFFYCAKASKSERNSGLVGTLKNASHDGRQKYIENPYQRHENKQVNNHPTVKPLSLMEYLCKLTRTPTGGIVLDPFMGSGTTGMACVKTNRPFIGIELEKSYLEMAEERIRKATFDWQGGPLFAELA